MNDHGDLYGREFPSLTTKLWSGRGKVLAHGLAYFCPNPVVFVLMTLGGFVEMVLLYQGSGNIYRDGGFIPVLAITFLVWYWATLGWLIWGGSLTLAKITGGGPRWVRMGLRGPFFVLVSGLIFLAMTSWGLYLRVGQFASIEAFEFVLLNRRMIWLYLVQVEWTDLCGLGVLSALVLGLVPVVWRAVCRSQWQVPSTASLTIGRFVIWSSLTLLFIGTIQVARREVSAVRRQCWREAVERRLDPVLTVAATLKNAWLQEKIEPCLSVAELRPLSEKIPNGPRAEKRPHSVIFVAIESLRNDVVHQRHQEREVMPALNQLAAHGLNLTRAYAQSTHSDYSDVCVASSLFPLRTRTHHFYRANDPWPKTLIYDLLKPAGYATAVISAQNEAWGAMDSFLKTPGLDLFYDAQTSGLSTRVAEADSGFADEVKSGLLRAGKLDDASVTTKAIEWIDEQARDGHPFFLSLNFQSSHFPYELDPDTERPFQPCTFDFSVSFIDYPVEKTDIVRNAYFNALHYCDRQLGRLVSALRELGRLDDTILVVYGENGEAFHENGFVTHAQKPVEPALRVACVIHAPDALQPGADDYPVELVDVVPTTLGLLKWPLHPNFQGIDLLAAGRPELEKRLLYFHTENPLTRTDAVLLGGRWKFAKDRQTQSETLIDLKVDPTESTNLVDKNAEMAAQLRELLSRWRCQQLAYHHFPFYFERFYPPSPPAIGDQATQARGLARR